MRLTCPNCGAQYEVPDAVIPTSGRDVQCSNCGNTWFQHHPDHAPPEPEPEADPVPPAPEPEPEPEPEPAPVSQRRIDPEVADILREEAERERAARAAEAAGQIETQPDLGLDAPDERGRKARARMERLRGDKGRDADASGDAEPAQRAPAAGAQEDIDPPSRRNLFPDIDEINSSLSSSEDNGMPPPILPEEALPSPRRSGFRAGFRLAVITVVVALIIYVMAPQIVALAPDLQGPLGQYVAAVDALRALLSQTVAGFLGQG